LLNIWSICGRSVVHNVIVIVLLDLFWLNDGNLFSRIGYAWLPSSSACTGHLRFTLWRVLLVVRLLLLIVWVHLRRHGLNRVVSRCHHSWFHARLLLDQHFIDHVTDSIEGNISIFKKLGGNSTLNWVTDVTFFGSHTTNFDFFRSIVFCRDTISRLLLWVYHLWLAWSIYIYLLGVLENLIGFWVLTWSATVKICFLWLLVYNNLSLLETWSLWAVSIGWLYKITLSTLVRSI
jgi:hypothetical protein